MKKLLGGISVLGDGQKPTMTQWRLQVKKWMRQDSKWNVMKVHILYYCWH